MAKTPNLGLTLTGTSESDSNQTFLNWRTDMSGVGPGSNMQLIDAAYGNLRQAQEDAADDIADLKDAVDELSALSDDVDDISQPYNLVTTHSRATFFVDPNNAYIQVDDSSPGEYNIWVARVEPGKTYAVLTDESPITYLLWMVSPIEVLGEDEIGIGNPLMDGATLLTSGSNIITIPNNVNNKFIAFRSSNGFTNGMVAECFAEPGYGTAETKTANDVMARAETKALKQEVADTKDVVMSAFVANTVSGTAISFDDGADDVPVGSFIIDIEATQSGSGDPSPDNVRTIVGRTSTTVTQHGKNLANVVDNTYTSSGVTFTSANGAVRMSGTSTGTINRTIGTVQLLAGVKYIISGTKSSGIADSDTLRIDLRTSSGSVIASGNSYDGFAYTPNEDIIAQVNIRFVSGQTINATIYPQVEAGEAATDFEPYVMISRMIDWSDVAGPIFHGTLDVLTGQLTVDRILFQTTWGAGTIQNTKNDIITKAFSLPMSYSIATGAPASSKCNVCTYKVSMSAYTESAFQFVMKQESGAYRWKLVMGLPSSTLDDQAIQVAYIVDAPVIYHLAPTEVRTLLGTNIISASSDNITLKYCASPSSIKNAIDDLVKVQATQPVEPDNKIWFDTDIDDEYTVPDYAEFTEVKGDVEDLKSQVENKANKTDYLQLDFVQGNRNSSGEIQASDYRISNDMALAENGLHLMIHPNGQVFAYRIFDNTRTSMIGSSWISTDTDFVVPIGCYYQFVVAKSNEGRITPSELAVMFEIIPISNDVLAAYETAVNGLLANAPAKLPKFDWNWWNKSFNSSSATVVANDNTRLTLIEPLAITAGTQIIVSPHDNVTVYTTLYTDDGSTKTIVARSGAYLAVDYTYTPDVDCYMMCDQKRANETSLPPSDNGVDIYVYRGIDVGPSNDNTVTMPTKYDVVPLKLKWEQGAVDNSGSPVERSDRIRAAVDISQIKAITYSLPNGLAAAVAFYDKKGGSKLRDSGWDNSGIGYRLCEGEFAYIVVHRTSDSNISPDDVTDEYIFSAAGSTMYNYDGVIKTLCHRGYDVVAPENTAISFIMAARRRMKYVETDVRFTSDGVAVMLHDASINRTARNADGTSLSSTVNISSITYAQALEYDFGIYKGAEYAGQKILSFVDFIVLCKKYDLFPIIEIKTGEPSDIVALQHIAESYGMHGQYGWIGATVYLQALIADISTTLCIRLTGTTESSINETIGLKTANNRIVSDFSVSQFASLTTETIQTIVTAGVEVGVWDILTEVDVNAVLNSPYVTWTTTDGIDIGVAAFVRD